MRFRLNHASRDLDLPLGELVIGRSSDCWLVIDDVRVSRHHARLDVTPDDVTLVNLGSRNGVLVNGNPIDGPRKLEDWDVIGVGGVPLMFQQLPGPATESVVPVRITTAADPELDGPMTMPAFAPRGTSRDGAPNSTARSSGPSSRDASRPHVPVEEMEESTQQINPFRIVGNMAEQALAAGRLAEAERLLKPLLDSVVTDASRQPASVSKSVAEVAARHALALANATGKGVWVSYVCALFATLQRPPSAALVDALTPVLRRVKPSDPASARRWLAALHEPNVRLNAADRMLVARLETLLRPVAAR